uniref:Uncharacterized protein n=1 Tax=Chromera velia CCMP2878 TaxID=1169474 RepID=A0A0G4HEH6_9ALVE|eukprot:Cvel_26632.t1-p1 / transcript=Cvel_26632.t1 / gene=Cvel_26632 / organism=Chromera_velia_CCMP2878 / gene_product=hypothetical protein / transcript_product=hypothetical protein / location=Cvel_scaffold3200:475-1124(+) / protein_length=92 / sequence_SO=supercontig / SO=protein_coding / is_pseudo=false
MQRLIEALRIRPDLYDARFLDDLRTLRNDMDDISKTFFDAKQKKNANAADMWIKEYMRKLQRFSIACGWTKETDWTVEGKLKNEREVLGLDE